MCKMGLSAVSESNTRNRNGFGESPKSATKLTSGAEISVSGSEDDTDDPVPLPPQPVNLSTRIQARSRQNNFLFITVTALITLKVIWHYSIDKYLHFFMFAHLNDPLFCVGFIIRLLKKLFN